MRQKPSNLLRRSVKQGDQIISSQQIGLLNKTNKTNQNEWVVIHWGVMPLSFPGMTSTFCADSEYNLLSNGIDWSSLVPSIYTQTYWQFWEQAQPSMVQEGGIRWFGTEAMLFDCNCSTPKSWFLWRFLTTWSTRWLLWSWSKGSWWWWS